MDVHFHVRQQPGNSHVNWHVVPLPPGVPYEEQQGAWVSWKKGVLKIPQAEMASLAGHIAQGMKRLEGEIR